MREMMVSTGAKSWSEARSYVVGFLEELKELITG